MSKITAIAVNVVALLVATAVVNAQHPCTRSTQCNDGNDSTLDYCDPLSSVCLFLVPRDAATLLAPVNVLPLSKSQKLDIIYAASDLFQNVNVNFFLYKKIYNFNTTSAFESLASSPSLVNLTNLEFHQEMIKIFSSANDRHARYTTPPILATNIATLGITVGRYFDSADSVPLSKRRRYVVSDIAKGVAEGSTFSTGVELETWNGARIDKAVQMLGRASYGANVAAKIARGVDLLYIRRLRLDRVPKSPSVKIGYRLENGSVDTVRLPWVFSNLLESVKPDALFLHLERDWVGQDGMHRVQKETKGTALDLDTPGRSETSSKGASCFNRTWIEVNPEFQTLFSAEILQTQTGPIGRVVLPGFLIPYFNTDILTAVSAELARILGLMPANGLILDARSNRGGSALYAKAVVELFADEATALPDYPLTARATDVNKKIFSTEPVNAAEGEKQLLVAFNPAILTARRAGEEFSGPVTGVFKLSLLRPYARRKRVYFGPVVTLINAKSYSAAELFAALQVDYNTSVVVGTDTRTGGGGGLPLSYSSFLRIFPRVFRKLAAGADFSTTFLRFYRGGANSGALIEHFGVTPHVRYRPTKRDVVDGDCDLFEFVGRLLRTRTRI